MTARSVKSCEGCFRFKLEICAICTPYCIRSAYDSRADEKFALVLAIFLHKQRSNGIEMVRHVSRSRGCQTCRKRKIKVSQILSPTIWGRRNQPLLFSIFGANGLLKTTPSVTKRFQNALSANAMAENAPALSWARYS